MSEPETAIVLLPADDERVAGAFARILADLGSPESLRAYREEWKRFGAYLMARGITALAAKTFDVQTYLLGLRTAGKKASTRARALAVVRAVYAALAREGVLIGANPAREARNPKGDAGALKTPWLSEEELTQFLAATPGTSFTAQRDYLISMTLAMTGLRRAEVARIAVEDFEPPDPNGDRRLHVRAKGGKHGTLKLVAPLAEAIDAWRVACGITRGPVFRRGLRGALAVGGGTVRNAVKRQAALAGFAGDDKFTPHAFRRSLATIADQRGVAKDVIQRGLLHSKSATTERYMKLGHAPKAPADAMVDMLPARFRK
jgi:integrase